MTTSNPRYTLCRPTVTLTPAHFLLPGSPGPTAGFIRTEVTADCQLITSYRDASGADLGYTPTIAVSTPAQTW